MIYRCGCCMLSGTAKYKVAWCSQHDMYECTGCWERGHPEAEEYSWGEEGGGPPDATEDKDPDPRRP